MAGTAHKTLAYLYTNFAAPIKQHCFKWIQLDVLFPLHALRNTATLVKQPFTCGSTASTCEVWKCQVFSLLKRKTCTLSAATPSAPGCQQNLAAGSKWKKSLQLKSAHGTTITTRDECQSCQLSCVQERFGKKKKKSSNLPQARWWQAVIISALRCGARIRGNWGGVVDRQNNRWMDIRDKWQREGPEHWTVFQCSDLR